MGLSPAERQRQYRERKQRLIDQMPKIPCECGCGTLIAPITKGRKPAQFAHGHNGEGNPNIGRDYGRMGIEALRAAGRLEGSGNHRWRGGEWRVGGGYMRATITEAEAALWPTALLHGGSRDVGRGWSIQRSHKVWNTSYPGDVVQPGDQVHHLNRIRDDDRVENLQKLARGDHHKLHAEERGPCKPRTIKQEVCLRGHPQNVYGRVSASGKSSWCMECGRLKMAARRAT